MAIVIDATVGGTASNSYITLADAKTILDNEINATAWTSATDDDERSQSLIQATRSIETFNLRGKKYNYLQALHFPAIHHYLGTMDVDADGNRIIPRDIELATCFGALWILRHKVISGVNDEILLGINNANIGGFSRSGGSQAKAFIGPVAYSHLKKFISFGGKII